MKTASKEVGSKPAHVSRWGRRGAAVAMLLAAMLLLPSCQGQSGSEGRTGSGASDMDVGNTTPCPCEASGTFLRVTLVARSGAEVTLRVEALIHGATALRVGDELRATWNGELPCSGEAGAIAVGEPALAVFTALRACDASECTELEPAQGSVQMTAWTDELLIAQTVAARLTVPAAELGQLWSGSPECRERFGDWSQLPGAFEDGVVP